MPEKRPSTRSPARLFYGWRIVGISGLMSGIYSGFLVRGASVWFLPIQEYFGLSRGAVSVAFSIARSEGAFEGPVVGWLLDKLGARTVILWATLLMVAGYLVLPLAKSHNPTTFWLFWFPVWLGAIAAGGNSAFSHGTHVVVANWFIRRRAFALGMLNSIQAVGAATLVPLVSWLLLNHGWRATSVIAGLTILVVALPLTLLFIRRSPEEVGQYPDGDPPLELAPVELPSGEAGHEEAAAPGHDESSRKGEERNASVRAALRSRSFWFLTAGNAMRNAVRSLLFVHLVAIIEWRGEDRQTAAFILGFSSLVEIFMQLTMGWLADRLPKGLVLGMGMLCGSAGALLLFPGMPFWTLFLVAILLAAMNGQGPVIWATVGDLFGRTNYGVLRGFVNFAATPGVLAAPALAGFWFDHSQSYTVPLALTAGIYAVSAVILMSLGRTTQRQS